MTEHKFGILRQFGSENFTYNTTINSESQTLTEQEIKDQIANMDFAIMEAFKACESRSIDEKEILINSSERRTAALKKHDEELKNEMEAAKQAQISMGNAQILDRAIKQVTKESLKEGKK